MFFLELLSLGTLCCPPGLSFGFHPVVEESCACLHHFEVLQGDVVEALGFVVGVDLLQSSVEQVAEALQVVGLFGELDEPLVSALGVLVHVDGCGCVFQHLCACLVAGVSQTLLGVVLDGSSPKALINDLVRPVMMNLYGFFDVKVTVSPIM